ncbi:TIGR02147 family protein [Bdellovibrio bacteriovorus]|uniref:TIGR02147 family protein n=1 Tax=Bdellovibrio TaxID=958 RepID=UPI0035A9656E
MKRTFAERCRKNSSYSLRAFSRSLGMDSSTVSAILKGKRPLTIKTAQKIVEGLNITNPVEAQALIMSTFAKEESETVPNYSELAMESAEAISSWQHFAILALLEIKDFKGQERAISERLNIPFGIVSECLNRLEKLGLIEKRDQIWQLTGKNMATPSQVPSAALRKGHRQFIEKALQSLEADPVDVRDISGITMAISKARLTEAKVMIQDFRRRLSTYMEEGKRDAVYRLNIQLFPLSQEKKP